MDVTIIIDGVKHRLVPDKNEHIEYCDEKCSLWRLCDTHDFLLCLAFKRKTHFEIEE